MTDKELVDWLRNCSIYEGRAFLRQAADRIEALEAENERLRDDSWFDQFEEQEQLRDNAEQRLSVVEAENERLRGALIAEREENLWSAYATGHVIGDEWTHLFMSDGEWLAKECGFDPRQGYYSAEAIRNAIPIAARAALGDTQ